MKVNVAVRNIFFFFSFHNTCVFNIILIDFDSAEVVSIYASTEIIYDCYIVYFGAIG